MTKRAPVEVVADVNAGIDGLLITLFDFVPRGEIDLPTRRTSNSHSAPFLSLDFHGWGKVGTSQRIEPVGLFTISWPLVHTGPVVVE